MNKPIGCDAWTGANYCDRYVPDSMHLDEVTDEVLCPEHAGPLGWSARLVNLYSLALRTAAAVEARLAGDERDVKTAAHLEWARTVGSQGKALDLPQALPLGALLELGASGAA